LLVDTPIVGGVKLFRQWRLGPRHAVGSIVDWTRRREGAAVSNAIAAFLLHLRDNKGKVPHAYFNWTQGNPFLYLIHYVLSGEGDVAPVTREVLRKAEPNAQRRPAIHAGI
jgi:hypothetical protein